MALEAINAVETVEAEAAALKAEAAQKAKELVAAAEAAGLEAVAAAKQNAADEISRLKAEAQNEAAVWLEQFKLGTESEKSSIREKATARLDEAAKMIMERIVSG